MPSNQAQLLENEMITMKLLSLDGAKQVVEAGGHPGGRAGRSQREGPYCPTPP